MAQTSRARAHIGRTIAESTPAFDPLPQPPDGAPNVVVIVLDDLGFAQLGCFGADIDTPAIDRLAAGGLRYRSFHVTALCSPTRACVLTGRNHHAVGMGFLTDIPIGFPGYNGRIPRSAATLPRLLRDAGYCTFAVGKWHLAPRWEQTRVGAVRALAARPRLRALLRLPRTATPTSGRPSWCATTASSSRRARPEDGLPPDRGSRRPRHPPRSTISSRPTPDKPFFLYFAPGAMHAPHQAPRAWIDALPRPLRRRLGGVARRAPSRASRSSAIVPRGATLPERAAVDPALERRSPATSAGSTPA